MSKQQSPVIGRDLALQRLSFVKSEPYRRKEEWKRVMRYYPVVSTKNRDNPLFDTVSPHYDEDTSLDTVCHRCDQATRGFGEPPKYNIEEQHKEAPSNWLLNPFAFLGNFKAKDGDCVVPCMTKPEANYQEIYKQVLVKWFPNEQRFRAEQANCNALVTGLPLYEIFTGHDIPQADELIVVVQKSYGSTLKGFLESEGYQSKGECSDRDVSIYVNHKTAIVKLIQWQHPPIHYILNSTYSAKMNFATSSKMYCLWESDTIREKIAYLFYPLWEKEDTDSVFEKELESKGFTIKKKDIPHDKMAKMTKLRRVCDQETKVIPLDSTNDQNTTFSDKVLEATSFQFRAGHQEHKGLCLRPLSVIRHKDLQHDYVAVEYFYTRNPSMCRAYRSAVQLLYGSGFKLGNEPHSFTEFQLLSDSGTQDADGGLASMATEKKDPKLLKILDEIVEAYPGHEREPTL
ncbi:hypothetical protein AA0117_g13295 [Alternaria alternata]|uniref:Uncharacterized protein n=1 Tax=Alternaria alternata TaxID=5599 RepID=A0A4Q4MMY1_ALTAL|nr:hypothetical protein AA0117_g13295 [Alternaria alternata]